MAAPLPLAAGLDWIEAILPFLFLLFWIVSQVRNLFVGAGNPAEKVVVRPRPKPPVADETHRELERQIEEFLRRSQGGQPAAPQMAPRREVPAIPRSRVTESKRGDRPPALPGERRPARPARDESVPRAAAPPAIEPVRPLGSLGGHATDVARHVEDAFAHDLEHRPAGLARPANAAASAPVAAPTTDIVELLRAPATLRQLVVIREVLDRPVDRW